MSRNTADLTVTEYDNLRANLARNGGGRILSSAPVTINRDGARLAGYAVTFESGTPA